MATVATRIVEVEFDAGVWTAVTADVVQVSTQRGRNKESGAFDTGRMQVTLRNDTRKYDPDNAAGTYYGKLRPNRRIRFKATWSPTTYDIWLGYIDRITQDYGGPNDATATIEASDFFKLLNRAELSESVYQAEVSDSSPKHWWPLSEPSGSTAAVDVVAGTVATSSGVTFGGAGLVTMDPTSSAVYDNAADVLTASVSDVAIGATVAFTLEAIVKVGTLPANDAAIITLQQAPVANFAGLSVWGSASGADAGKVAFAYNSLATGTDGVILGANINDGAPHHIMATVTSAGVEKLYIDGVSSGTPTASGTLTYTGTMPVYIGNNASTNRGFNGLIGHVALYDSALAAADALNHYGARAAPWDDDTPGERLTRVFLLVNAAGDYELDDGSPPTLQSTELGGTALAYAQKVEETALGRLFVTKDGTVRFIGRDEAEEGTYLTSQATLVDDDSGAGTPYRDVSAEVDEATLVTRATVSRANGTAVTYRDDTAITEFGVLDETHSGLLHDDDAYSLSYATLIVNTHKTPATRVGTVELELAKDAAAMFPAILALEIADRVTYKRKPQNTGSVMTLPMRVEAISHDTGAHYWRTRLYLTPINLGAGGYGIGVWDSSLWDQAIWGI